MAARYWDDVGTPGHLDDVVQWQSVTHVGQTEATKLEFIIHGRFRSRSERLRWDLTFFNIGQMYPRQKNDKHLVGPRVGLASSGDGSKWEPIDFTRGMPVFGWLSKVRRKGKDFGPGRRLHERTRARLPFGLEVGDYRLVGTTSELCMNGARLQVDGGLSYAPSLPGHSGVLRVMLPTGEIRCDCKITRVEWGNLAVELIGLRRTAMGAELMDYLETQLGEVW